MRVFWIPLGLALVAGALVFGIGLGSDAQPPADTSPPRPTPAASQTVSVRTLDDLLARARPDADGNVDLSVNAPELTAVANSELPADSPVRAVELDVRPGENEGGRDDRPRIDFRAEVRSPDVEVTGEVALGLQAGQVTPQLLDVRAGVLPLPGPLRAPVQDVVDDAARLFAELSARGVDVTDLQVRDGQLHIAGHVRQQASWPAEPTPDR